MSLESETFLDTRETHTVRLWSGYWLDQGGRLTGRESKRGRFSPRTALRLAEKIGTALPWDLAEDVQLVDESELNTRTSLQDRT